MNYILLFFFVLSCVGGFVRGVNDTIHVKNDPSKGVQESKNIFTFLFLD